MDYQKFRKEYEASGLSQKSFGEQRSMSSSMVSYYLRKSREAKVESVVGEFHPLSIEEPEVVNRAITITTPAGLQISIPL